ncbi:hypothetical protein C8R44DRAFT_799896, partial [Mycena epipterygia]
MATRRLKPFSLSPASPLGRSRRWTSSSSLPPGAAPRAACSAIFLLATASSARRMSDSPWTVA